MFVCVCVYVCVCVGGCGWVLCVGVYLCEGCGCGHVVLVCCMFISLPPYLPDTMSCLPMLSDRAVTEGSK